MTLKREILDSSSEEESKENYTSPQHLDFLLRNILDISYISTSKGLKLRLGLILHNLADRFFKYSAIRNSYKKIKSEILTVDNESLQENLQIIKTAFNKHFNKLFKDYNKENISDKDYQELLHCVFNPNHSIPKIFTLAGGITAEYAKKVLLQELQNSNINLKSISNNSLNFTIHNSKELLAFTKTTTKTTKITLKSVMLDGMDDNSSTICNIPNTMKKTFTANHVMHYKSGNIQTDVPGFGTYDEILSKFNQRLEHKNNIIERIFEVIKNKEASQTIQELPRDLNYFAEKLTYLLFVVEIYRNNATLFTAPMFLELIEKNSIFLSNKEFFPMSTEHAVAQARGIIKNYKYVLPNSYSMDYDITNVQNGDLLLIKEGNILIEWLSEKLNNYKLANIARIFDILSSMQFYKKMDNIKINDIKHFLEQVNKLEHCPTDLLNSLDQNLTALILKVNNIGERNLKLTKTKLLEKKDFSRDLKDLIEITYLEFTESLRNIEGFLAQKQASLKKEIKKILPEILQILCAKVKEWYDIDAPEYTKDVLQDITAKFNQTTTPRKRLKLSFSKGKNIDGENDDDVNQIVETTAIDDSMKGHFELMGEHTNITYD
ncbi:MAG TPA: hypothetical protein LFW20_00895 [Rickettsia endosymbiont of Omalisus fontisbellaquei]|nr:hypothetical protein [Rickettsia endosymbiont of Omalisus fontisbellaquei]